MKLALAAMPLAVLLVGCGSSWASDGVAGPSGSPSAADSPGDTTCTTHRCIATDAEGLKGTVAKDNSVMTKVTCKPSTVKQVVSGTYTVHCTVTYSDGMVANGIASVLTGKGEVDWEPTHITNYGS